MKFLGFALLIFVLWTEVASAATDCDEWATMTQVLVIRWQGDPSFKDKSSSDVKKELNRTMGAHPEIKTAEKWTDYAYKHRAENPVDVWKNVKRDCSSVAI